MGFSWPWANCRFKATEIQFWMLKSTNLSFQLLYNVLLSADVCLDDLFPIIIKFSKTVRKNENFFSIVGIYLRLS